MKKIFCILLLFLTIAISNCALRPFETCSQTREGCIARNNQLNRL